jgi:hypothetical protein
LDIIVGQQNIEPVEKHWILVSLPVRGSLASVLGFFLVQKAIKPFFPAMLGFSLAQAFNSLSTA